MSRYCCRGWRIFGRWRKHSAESPRLTPWAIVFPEPWKEREILAHSVSCGKQSKHNTLSASSHQPAAVGAVSDLARALPLSVSSRRSCFLLLSSHGTRTTKPDAVAAVARVARVAEGGTHVPREAEPAAAPKDTVGIFGSWTKRVGHTGAGVGP